MKDELLSEMTNINKEIDEFLTMWSRAKNDVIYNLIEKVKFENEKLKQQTSEANEVIINFMNYFLEYEGGWTEDSFKYTQKYGIDIIDGKWRKKE